MHIYTLDVYLECSFSVYYFIVPLITCIFQNVLGYSPMFILPDII